MALTIALVLLSSAETLYLNLEQALDLALRQSPQAVEASVARLQAALALGQGAGAILPTPQATLAHSSGTTGPGLWTGTLTVSQVLFDPAAFAGLISGILNASYHSLEAREKTAALVYQTTTDYLNLLKAKMLVHAAQVALEQANASRALTSERARLGQATRIDLLRSEAFYSQAEVNLITAEKGFALAQERLCATAGLTRPVTVEPTETLCAPAEFPDTDPDRLLEAIERSNPGVRMSRSLKTAARLNLGAAFARILPSITFYRSWISTDTVFSARTLRCRAPAVTDGINFTLPLANIKEFILNIGSAFAGDRQARAALARARLELRATARSALLELQESRVRYEQAERNLKLHQELYHLAVTQHRLGALTLTELLEIQANLAQAEANYRAALCDTYISSARIGYLLGNTTVFLKE